MAARASAESVRSSDQRWRGAGKSAADAGAPFGELPLVEEHGEAVLRERVALVRGLAIERDRRLNTLITEGGLHGLEDPLLS